MGYKIKIVSTQINGTAIACDLYLMRSGRKMSQEILCTQLPLMLPGIYIVLTRSKKAGGAMHQKVPLYSSMERVAIGRAYWYISRKIRKNIINAYGTVQEIAIEDAMAKGDVGHYLGGLIHLKHGGQRPQTKPNQPS